MNLMRGRYRRFLRQIALWAVALSLVATASTGPTLYRVLGDFGDGWDENWKEKRFTRSSNRFEMIREESNAVLRVTSSNSAAGMFRDLKIEPLQSAQFSWRWKVDRSLADNTNERQKQGDDYAARVFVVFKSSIFLPWTSRAICYVWAGHDSVGSVYKNPFSGGVMTMVLQSGDDRVGEWLTEERDIVADYIRCFGKAPDKVSGFAVMVDTDQTGAEATAWFDDMVLVVR